MNKSMKKYFAIVVAMAMTASLCSGIPVNETSAEEATQISPAFMAYLIQNNSKIILATQNIVRRGTELVEVDDEYELAEGEEWEAMGCVDHTEEITSIGTYSLEAEAEDDVDDLLEEARYLAVDFGSMGKTVVDGTYNYILPTSYYIQPKTINITSADGTQTRALDWSENGKVYNAGNRLEERLRIGIVNQYIPMDSAHAEEYQLGNPFLTNVDGEWVGDGDPVVVSKGDKLTFTFEVTTEAPTVTPTGAPNTSVTPRPSAVTVSRKPASTSCPKVMPTPRTGKGKQGNTISKTKPVIVVKAGKTKEGISYIKIRLKKYMGTNVVIYYKTKHKKWTKIKATSSSIAKNRKIFRIRCSSRRQKYYFRVRTYRRQNGKNKYSRYSEVKSVRIS